MLDIQTNQKQVPQEETTEEMNQELKKKIVLPLPEKESNNLEFKESKIIIPFKEDLVNQHSEDKSSHKTVEKTVEKIIAAIKENPKITIKELGEKTVLSRRGVEWNIEKLKQQGKLKRIGSDKGGYWEVIL
ncbi:hypothetical protein BREVNS_1962 [Brevinematales bacterium NS]|nr:hypothetical protein BREVNS_1962 [Brevinematales bacterium NS]